MSETNRNRRERWAQAYNVRRESARQRRAVDAAWRITILMVGLTIVTFGALLLVFPGPGWPTILLGLIIIASEFTWANRLVDPVKRTTQRVTDSVKERTSRRQQIAILLLIVFISVTGTILILAR
jgi:uncharacterized protein (TIGR02611 family)